MKGRCKERKAALANFGFTKTRIVYSLWSVFSRFSHLCFVSEQEVTDETVSASTRVAGSSPI